MIVDPDKFLAWFVGPDDDGTCDGCEDAVTNNPYPIDECPEPGDFECGSHCRHMVQLDDDAPDDFAPYAWNGAIGFGDSGAAEYDDELDSLLSKDKLTKADVEDFLADSGVSMSDLEDEMDADDFNTLQDALDSDAESDTLEDALSSGDVDAAALNLDDSDKLDDAIEMGKNGISDDVSAFALADALTDATGNVYTPVLQGNVWIVSTLPLREGGAGSGNFGHEGRPGQRGGSVGISDRKRAIFMIGGGGSGKGTVINANYQGMYHMDPDAVKQSEPMYSNKAGIAHQETEDSPIVHVDSSLYGPSGPRTIEQFEAYPKDVQDAQNAWIRSNTPYQNAIEFAEAELKNNPQGNYFGGGLTHELSSTIAKNKLAEAIHDGTKSFVYDSTGSAKYVDAAAAARSQGYDVTFHQVYMPEEKAVLANSLRPRSVPEDLLRATHAKVRDVLPVLRDSARQNHYHWRYTDNTEVDLAKRSQEF